MSKVLATTTLLLSLLLIHGTGMPTAWDDEDFFKYCPQSRCSDQGPEIRFPYRLESSETPPSCGAPSMNLACSGQDTILDDPVIGRYKVTAIDYRHAVLKIIPLVDPLSPCPLPKIELLKTYDDDYHTYTMYWFVFGSIVRCSGEFTPSIQAGIFVPITCLANASHFSYLVDGGESMSVLPLDCKVVSNDVIPIPTCLGGSTFKQSAERIFSFAETTVCWNDMWYGGSITYNCTECERRGRRCAFSPQRNQTFCMRHGIISN